MRATVDSGKCARLHCAAQCYCCLGAAATQAGRGGEVSRNCGGSELVQLFRPVFVCNTLQRSGTEFERSASSVLHREKTLGR